MGSHSPSLHSMTTSWSLQLATNKPVVPPDLTSPQPSRLIETILRLQQQAGLIARRYRRQRALVTRNGGDDSITVRRSIGGPADGVRPEWGHKEPAEGSLRVRGGSIWCAAQEGDLARRGKDVSRHGLTVLDGSLMKCKRISAVAATRLPGPESCLADVSAPGPGWPAALCLRNMPVRGRRAFRMTCVIGRGLSATSSRFESVPAAHCENAITGE